MVVGAASVHCLLQSIVVPVPINGWAMGHGLDRVIITIIIHIIHIMVGIRLMGLQAVLFRLPQPMLHLDRFRRRRHRLLQRCTLMQVQ